MSAPGRRAGRWLRNRAIRTKLSIILTIPVVAVVVLAALVFFDAYGSGQRAEEARRVVALGVDTGALVAQLHHERAAAALVFAPGGGDGRSNAGYRAAVQDTDAAAVAFRERSGGISVSPDVRLVLDRIGDGLEDLSALRRQVQDDPRALSSVILFRYRALIADLLTFRASLSQIGVPAATGNELRAAAALSQAIEAQGLLQVAVIRALAGGVLTPAMQQEIVGASSMFGESLTDFQLLAPAVWRARLNTDVTGPVVAGAERDQGVVTRTPPGERVKLAVDAAGWSSAMTARMDLMHAVEAAIDRQILAEVAAQRDAARRSAAMIAALVLTVLALTAGVGVVAVRSMSRSLNGLRLQAADVALNRLPTLVAKIDAQHADAAAVRELVAAAATPIAVDGRDEVGQVATAFNTVVAAAAGLAAGQAGARASATTIVASLAWRLKRQVDEVAGELDRVQRDQVNPEVLAGLYRVDTAATRIRRRVANLLVLAGQHSRGRSEPVSLIDVLRAAAQVVAGYERIDERVSDARIFIHGSAVDDLVSLLTELLDNATSYSPPESQVSLHAAVTGDLLHLQIADRGLGMSPEAAARVRAMFAAPGVFDEHAARHMGIPVAATLAYRLQLSVAFRSEQQAGTRVDVTVPSHLFMVRPDLGLPPVELPTAAVDEPTRELRRQGPPSALTASTWRPLAVAPSGPGWGQQLAATTPIFDEVSSRRFVTFPEPGPFPDAPTEPLVLAHTESNLPIRQRGRHYYEVLPAASTVTAAAAPIRRDPAHMRHQLAGFQATSRRRSLPAQPAHLVEAPQ
ncbi:nitrate- and nitrite sensing domain-containing protein [Dactylosporangium sp. NPDC005572]|uniref:sensor histidine kinase n=1 Tax=Dactylosporangium sp. NPDC005572 TaxID=3156889 RepID=UPI0033BB068E